MPHAPATRYDAGIRPKKDRAMNRIIYIVGVIVIIFVILRVLGLV